jgi:hypothetical protein
MRVLVLQLVQKPEPAWLPEYLALQAQDLKSEQLGQQIC